MKDINLKFLNFLSKIPLFSLVLDSSGVAWEKAEKSFTHYNETLITLSSSILVLSFSVIKIVGINVNKILLGVSWTFFALAILCGILILFLKFLANLSDGILFANDKKITKERANRFRIIYANSMIFMYLFGILQIVFFTVGLFSLMSVAFLIIT